MSIVFFNLCIVSSPCRGTRPFPIAYDGKGKADFSPQRLYWLDKAAYPLNNSKR